MTERNYPRRITQKEWRSFYRKMMPLIQELEMRTRGGFKKGAPDDHIFLEIRPEVAEIIHKAADEALIRMAALSDRKKTRDLYKRLFGKKYKL